MIITISGMPGAGKSTVGRALAQRLHLSYASVGDYIRTRARDAGKNLLDLMKDKYAFAQVQREVESYIDRLAEQKNIIIDGRDAFYHVRESLNVFLTVDETAAAKRIHNAGRTTEKFASAAAAKKSLSERRAREQDLYQQLHKIDIYNPIHYDIIIDTTHLSVPEIVEQIAQAVR